MRMLPARTMRRVLNLWPPFLFTGIHVSHLADDFRSARVATIDFEKPGRGRVSAEFLLDDAVLDELREAAAGGDKVLRWFETPVRDAQGDTVALVRKQLYVRRKRNTPSM